jgi:hypothetical protein
MSINFIEHALVDMMPGKPFVINIESSSMLGAFSGSLYVLRTKSPNLTMLSETLPDLFFYPITQVLYYP